MTNKTKTSRPYFQLIGFLLFAIGLLSILLKASGMQFSFMSIFQKAFGEKVYYFYILISVAGFILFYLMSSAKDSVAEYREIED